MRLQYFEHGLRGLARKCQKISDLRQDILPQRAPRTVDATLEKEYCSGCNNQFPRSSDFCGHCPNHTKVYREFSAWIYKDLGNLAVFNDEFSLVLIPCWNMFLKFIDIPSHWSRARSVIDSGMNPRDWKMLSSCIFKNDCPHRK